MGMMNGTVAFHHSLRCKPSPLELPVHVRREYEITLRLGPAQIQQPTESLVAPEIRQPRIHAHARTGSNQNGFSCLDGFGCLSDFIVNVHGSLCPRSTTKSFPGNSVEKRHSSPGLAAVIFSRTI